MNERSGSIGWSSDRGSNKKETKETSRKDLKDDESDRDDRGELENLLSLIVMYRVLCRVKVGKIQNNKQQNQVEMKGDDSEQ